MSELSLDFVMGAIAGVLLLFLIELIFAGNSEDDDDFY